MIVGAGAIEPSVSRADWFRVRVFCVPLNSRENPGFRYHTEVIKILSIGKSKGRLLVTFHAWKEPKTTISSTRIWFDLSIHRCGWWSTSCSLLLLSPLSCEDCLFDLHALPCQSSWRPWHVLHQPRISLARPWMRRLAPKPFLSIVRTAPYPCESS